MSTSINLDVKGCNNNVSKQKKNNPVVGAAEVAGGSYIGYEGLKHGLPRALGLRTEFHITSKENADSIKKGGNILDPKFGGKNGWSKAVNSSRYIKNSKGFVHITGIHESATGKLPFLQKYEYLKAPFRALQRNVQNIMYRSVGNGFGISCINKKPLEIASEIFKKGFLGNNTKRFYICGTDSYFNKEFISDTDDFALKSSKKLKVFENRFSAMADGLKKFGLKGMKENKGRVAFGVGLVATGVGCGAKLISAGLDRFGIKNVNEPEKEKDVKKVEQEPDKTLEEIIENMDA